MKLAEMISGEPKRKLHRILSQARRAYFERLTARRNSLLSELAQLEEVPS